MVILESVLVLPPKLLAEEFERSTGTRILDKIQKYTPPQKKSFEWSLRWFCWCARRAHMSLVF